PPPRAWTLRVIGIDADGHDRPSRRTHPVRSVRSNMTLAAFFVVALVAIVVGMHCGVTRAADAKLRGLFDADGQRGEVSRRLMHDVGYNV
ncbi:hypothetical protein, partial [Escherichia coli]|uniref:hypothetical protein n=2 Tax=Pseudomonadota TaxID=1224 RepID=UPI0019D521A9